MVVVTLSSTPRQYIFFIFFHGSHRAEGEGGAPRHSDTQTPIRTYGHTDDRIVFRTTVSWSRSHKLPCSVFLVGHAFFPQSRFGLDTSMLGRETADFRAGKHVMRVSTVSWCHSVTAASRALP